MSKLIFVTGGARSGKSRYALGRASTYASRAFIASAVATDDEMKQRIEKHKKERGGEWITVEEPIDLAAAVSSLPAGVDVAIIDCVTVWLGNLLHKNYGTDTKFEELGCLSPRIPEIAAFLSTLESLPCDLIVVSNEVGMGIVPHNDLARAFRDVAGTVNQKLAELAHEAVFMVSGLPMELK